MEKVALEKLQSKLNFDIDVESLEYLVGISSELMQYIFKLRYVDGLTFNKINNILNIKSSNALDIKWRSNIDLIARRLQLTKDVENIANIDISMNLYKRIIRYKNPEHIKIRDLLETCTQYNNRLIVNTGYKGVGIESIKEIHKSIDRYYSGISTWGIKCVQKI